MGPSLRVTPSKRGSSGDPPDALGMVPRVLDLGPLHQDDKVVKKVKVRVATGR